MKKILINLLATLLFVTPTFAEIQTVTINWTAQLCRESCIKGLEKQFRSIKGAAAVNIDQNDGRAVLTWNPNIPFTFSPVNTAMSMIGLTINDLHAKVRGTITHNDRNKTVTLTSIGDSTSFVLLGPVQTDPNRYVVQYNAQTHILTSAQRDQLLDAEKKKQVVTIAGPIFQPERSPPLYLIIESINVEKADTTK